MTMINVSADWWRHLVMGLIAVVVPAVLGYLGHVDWTTFGPYAAMIQFFVQAATELYNQYAAKK